jgi:hypothetical protein
MNQISVSTVVFCAGRATLIIGSGTALTNLNYNAITNIPDFISASYLNNSLTEERPHPPNAFNSSTPETPFSGEILNIAPSSYIKESITLNTSGITYGSGVYELYSSNSATVST